MAFTQSEVDALRRAIASGTRRFQYQGRTIEYRDLAEMRDTLEMMQSELNGTGKTRIGTRRVFASHSKGLC